MFQKNRKMQKNETEIGDTAASNYICKKTHVQIDVYVQTRFSLFSKKSDFSLSIDLSRFPPLLT